MHNALTDVPGIVVGHWDNAEAGTGCTVILTLQGVTAGVDVRGSAPGTRETDLLAPTCYVDRVHAIVLSGGSAFGLDAAGGAMRWLEERGYGWYTPVARIPIVPAAILFDLGVGDARVRPTADDVYAACEAASGEDAARGNVGVGMGCTVGKLLGPAGATKSGLGQASVQLPGDIVVAALVAVNALGDVVDPARNAIVAGARDEGSGKLVDGLATVQGMADQFAFRPPDRQNTTIGVVATNVRLDKALCTKMAQVAHNGLARTVRPVHTLHDGDCFFVLSTDASARSVDLNLLIGTIAQVVEAAVLDAVRSARAAYGLPAAADLEPLPLE